MALTYSESDSQLLAHFIKMDFSPVVRLWPGGFQIRVSEPGTTQRVNYLPVGRLGLTGISGISGTTATTQKGIQLTLSAVDSDIATKITANTNFNNIVIHLYHGFIDRLSYDENVTIERIFKGYISQVDSEIGPKTGTITVDVENMVERLKRGGNHLRTAEGQKTVFPSDTGFNRIAGLQNKNVTW